MTLLAADDPISGEVRRWLTSYITQPHHRLGRRGPVCPFVEPALDANKVSIAAWRFGFERNLELMSLAIERGMDCFQELVHGEDEPDLVSLIVTFPDLGRTHWHLIDDGHRAEKTLAVENGLMLGQFHPACDAPAARNPTFPVNRAPIPLIVIRHMAPHDILFLEDNPVWIDRYRAMMEARGIAADHSERRFERVAKGRAR